MTIEFPELNSFGNVLKFAAALEQKVADYARRAEDLDDFPGQRELLSSCAKKHERRLAQLERIRRERLNEMVLQPIYGLNGADYVESADLPGGSDVGSLISRLVHAEESTARFYTDAADVAANVLTGVERTFKKLAKESRSFADQLKEANL